MIKSLSDEVLDKLLEDHWREIKGIIEEIKRRRAKKVAGVQNGIGQKAP